MVKVFINKGNVLEDSKVSGVLQNPYKAWKVFEKYRCDAILEQTEDRWERGLDLGRILILDENKRGFRMYEYYLDSIDDIIDTSVDMAVLEEFLGVADFEGYIREFKEMYLNKEDFAFTLIKDYVLDKGKFYFQDEVWSTYRGVYIRRFDGYSGEDRHVEDWIDFCLMVDRGVLGMVFDVSMSEMAEGRLKNDIENSGNIQVAFYPFFGDFYNENVYKAFRVYEGFSELSEGISIDELSNEEKRALMKILRRMGKNE